jgi:hypothetical protein
VSGAPRARKTGACLRPRQPTGGNATGHGVRFPFPWRVDSADQERTHQCEGRGRPGSPLLDNVGQFVSQQVPPVYRPGLVAAGSENDVPPDGVGGGVQVPRALRRRPVRMHADVSERMAEPGLHRCAHGRIQGLTRGPQHIVNWCGYKHF